MSGDQSEARAGETFAPLPGTNRRIAIALLLAFGIWVSGSMLIKVTHSWWWAAAMKIATVLVVTIATVLDARERGWPVRREILAVLRTRPATEPDAAER